MIQTTAATIKLHRPKKLRTERARRIAIDKKALFYLAFNPLPRI